MANTIRLKTSSVAAKVPTTAQLALGELAINTTDGKLFLKKSVSGTETVVDVTASVSGGFPSGTAMLFVQTAAPTGWTKRITHNDKALRVVSGTASSGGTSAFSTAFASRTPSGSVSSVGSSGSTTATGSITVSGGTVAATTLATTQIPSHSHTIPANALSSLYPTWGATQTAGYGLYSVILIKNTTSGLSTDAQGGGTSHTHTFTAPSGSFTGTAHSHTVSVSSSFTGTAMDFAVQYVDVIIAVKD